MPINETIGSQLDSFKTTESNSEISMQEENAKKLSKERPTTKFRANLETLNDSNNNNSNRSPNEQKDSHNLDEQTHDAEDWQILEVDEQQAATSSHDDSGYDPYLDEHNNYNNNNIMTRQSKKKPTSDGLTKLKSDETKSDQNQYIEVNPLGSAEEYSQVLIYICTAIYSLVQLISIVTILTLIGLLFTRFYYITLICTLWMIYDRDTCNRGGRRIDFVYRSKFWTYLAAYFPIKLRHTVNFKLNPNENYILNYHPHGISAFGSVVTFATNGLNFSKLFPGITTRFMVHETSFMVPFMREVFACRGDCSVNSRSIDYILGNKSKSGNLLTIVVGGLAEADLSNSEVLKIVITGRKGFVKKALIHGANIIPCIAFGENSVFKKVDLKPESSLHRLETCWYNLFKFKHPIYYGKSIFSKNLKGLLPYERPITVVLGDPIQVEKIISPTQEEIDKIHSIYLNRVREMYEANKDLCDTFDKRLELI